MNRWINIILFFIGTFIAIWFLEGWGLTGIIIFILILGLYKLYKKRDAFEAGISNVETMIWGKPLKKEYWKKGEMKNTKIKLSWGKSKWFSWKQLSYLIWIATIMILFIVIWRYVL